MAADRSVNAREVVVAAATFENERDPVPKLFSGKIGALIGEGHRYKNAKDGTPAFSLAKYRPGAPRANDNVEVLAGLVLDFDHISNEAMKKISRAVNGFAYVAYSTFSHKEHGPDDNCFRIVIPFSRPVSKEEYASAWAAMRERIGGHMDSSAKDPARIFFFPFCPESRNTHAFVRYRDGSLLEPGPPSAAVPEVLGMEVRNLPSKPIAEGFRNVTLASLAGTMRRRGMAAQEILVALQEVNRCRCVPSLAESEVSRIASSVSRYEPKPTTLPQSPLRPIPIGELLAKPALVQNWLVDSLLPAGGMSLVAAKAKVGKSTLMRELALAVARGQEFLGRPTQTGSVLYLALEEREADVIEHFRRMGATERDSIRIHCGSVSPDALREIREWLEKESAALIVVDTLQRLVGVRDINDYAQVTTRLTPLLELAHRFNCHISLVHHAKKADADVIDAPLGSTALGGSVDTIITLKRNKEGRRTIETRQRTGRDLSESILEFDELSGRSFLGNIKAEYEIQECECMILEYLCGQPAGVPEKTIKAEVQGDNFRKQKALRQLVDKGKVSRSGEGKRGSEFLYQLPQSSLPHFPPEKSEKVRNDSPAPTNRNQETYSHLAGETPSQ